MSSNVTAPAGMSRAEALEGLWKCSTPARFFQMIPNGEDVRKNQEADAWRSKEKVEETIQRNPRIDYFGGRCIKTDMSQYPKLDLSSYKQRCEIAMSFVEIFEKCLKKKS